MNRFTIYCVGLTLMVFFTGQTLAQVNEKIYFDKEGNISSASTAEFYITWKVINNDENLIAIDGFYLSGKKKLQGNFIIKENLENIDFSGFNKPEFWHVAVNDGAYKEWYKSGKIKVEGEYIKGFKDGTYKEYFENGRLKSESSYKDGKAEGMVSIYDENGNLNLQFMMVANQIHGELISYFENGKKKASHKFKDNVDIQETTLWDPDGNEITIVE